MVETLLVAFSPMRLCGLCILLFRHKNRAKTYSLSLDLPELFRHAKLNQDVEIGPCHRDNFQGQPPATGGSGLPVDDLTNALNGRPSGFRERDFQVELPAFGVILLCQETDAAAA